MNYSAYNLTRLQLTALVSLGKVRAELAIFVHILIINNILVLLLITGGMISGLIG